MLTRLLLPVDIAPRAVLRNSVIPIRAISSSARERLALVQTVQTRRNSEQFGCAQS